MTNRDGFSRRTFIKTGAAAAGALAAGRFMPLAPAVAGANNAARIGVFGGDFGNLSPMQRWDIQNGLVMYNLFDQLSGVDFARRQIVPMLAEDWTNPDPLTWRIKLREGVRWHRGYGEVTAADVVYTWLTHLATSSYQVGTGLFLLDSVTAEGKYVVEVKTKTPFGPFPGTVLSYGGSIVSEKAHKEMGDQAYSARPVGNGPYMVETVRGSEIELVRNPDYWRAGHPKLERLFYRAIPDSGVRLQSLIRGELDFITHPDPRDVAQMRQNSDFETVSTPGWNWDFQQFNLAGNPDHPFQDKRVRQAISYAIDREAIVREIYGGEATPTDNQLPAGYLGHESALLRYPVNGDLAKARELMAASGTTGFEVEVITSDKDWLRKELELVAAMVSQIGITYRIRNLDIGGFNNSWINKNYQQHLEDITMVSPDPDAACWWTLHSQGSLSGNNDTELDALLDGARELLDPAEREPLYHRITARTVEECPTIYHCNANYVQIFRKGLSGFQPTPQEYVQRHDATMWS